MSVHLDSSAMQQLDAEQRVLLDTVDELRILGLGRFVDLPQLIVVGNQSAGKSSVLEAISRVRFPVHDGACTRFATELVLRQSSVAKIDVKINNESLEALAQTAFSQQDLPRIVEEAKQRMGLVVGTNSFSEDALRIEISGPALPQLTLVDLPGLYTGSSETQSSDDAQLVLRLAEKYMKQENSIILAIVSAKDQLVLQSVLVEAKRHDPARERTFGIITKPDQVEEDSENEQIHLRLAKNQESSHRLALGWHVLRNRGHKEAALSDKERDENEELFFQSGSWSNISLYDRGIGKLRHKLSHVLFTHIQRKLPGLIDTIEKHIKQRQARLRELGDPRSSPQELRKYLTKISSLFHDLALDAVRGNYVDDFFGGLYPSPDAGFRENLRVRKLRALVRDANRAFYHVLEVKGERRRIQWDAEDENRREQTAPKYLQDLVGRYEFEDPAFVDIADLNEELEAMASENQGTEFPGSPNDRLTLRLFRDQSKPWEAIAARHVDLVITYCKSFVEQLVFHVAGPDTKTAEALLNGYVDAYFDGKKAVLKAKMTELLHHYKHGYDPQPLHTDFNLRILRRRKERLVTQMTDRLQHDQAGLSNNQQGSTRLSHENVKQAVLEASAELGSEFGTERIIDNMLTYYEMSLRTFVDNVMILALENCLVSEIPDILTADKVHDMSDEVVLKLASESAQVLREREELETQLGKLQKGLRACQVHRPRVSAELLPDLPSSVDLTLRLSSTPRGRRAVTSLPESPSRTATPSNTIPPLSSQSVGPTASSDLVSDSDRLTQQDNNNTIGHLDALRAPDLSPTASTASGTASESEELSIPSKSGTAALGTYSGEQISLPLASNLVATSSVQPIRGGLFGNTTTAQAASPGLLGSAPSQVGQTAALVAAPAAGSGYFGAAPSLAGQTAAPVAAPTAGSWLFKPTPSSVGQTAAPTPGSGLFGTRQSTGGDFFGRQTTIPAASSGVFGATPAGGLSTSPAPGNVFGAARPFGAQAAPAASVTQAGGSWSSFGNATSGAPRSTAGEFSK
ncbi:hypothetical protein B0T24DRAFT_626798 [Lasiosphaeria ovina]|uniref:Dynamin family protein n=1 Tax=Lasiosphaeria ovina TaxID=92902 RepID=A0AAE0KDI1_9PEZI|nr:hypothetical protein B0T24DRAFT_626798 [Lasiosphaeria ovina]